MESELAELKSRVASLERLLEEERSKRSKHGREKIQAMSSEVVDSNPYRSLMLSFVVLILCLICCCNFQPSDGTQTNGRCCEL